MCSNESLSSVVPNLSRLQQVHNQRAPSNRPVQSLSPGALHLLNQSNSASNRTLSIPPSLDHISSLDSVFAQQLPTSSAIGLSPGSTTTTMSTMLSVPSTSGLLSLDHYRFHLYNYAMAERIRSAQYTQPMPQVCSNYPAAAAAAAAAAMGPYGPRLALSMSLFHNRVFQPEEPKPQHSYIGLIAIAILSSPESKLVLSDIYQHILDNYPYFRSRGPGWRNSIRHNLSLNDCFVKAGRSANGKGHYWAIHPANREDFKKGDFRRRKAQRKVRKHMGLSVDDEGADSPSPPPLSITPPQISKALQNLWGISGAITNTGLLPPSISTTACRVTTGNNSISGEVLNVVAATRHYNHHQQQHQPIVTTTKVFSSLTQQSSTRKRQFDVASLLAPDSQDSAEKTVLRPLMQYTNPHLPLVNACNIDEDIDVEENEETDNNIREDCDTENYHNKQKTRIFAEKANPSPQRSNLSCHSSATDLLQLSEPINQILPRKCFQDPNICDLVESGDDTRHFNYRSSPDKPNLEFTPIVHQQSDMDNSVLVNKSGLQRNNPWHGLVHQWPHHQTSNGGFDPRILVSRYYGQYIAAAAVVQQQHHHQNQSYNSNLNGSNDNNNNNNIIPTDCVTSNSTNSLCGNEIQSSSLSPQQYNQQQSSQERCTPQGQSPQTNHNPNVQLISDDS